MSWQYTDATNSVVFQTLPNGSMRSIMVFDPEIQAWLAEGNTPSPAPVVAIIAPTPPTLAELQAQLATLTAQIAALVNSHTGA